jgi:tRNA 2-selenouridine synthase
LVAANISKHIQTHVLDLPRNWQPLVYCWRGGKRSGSLAMVLGQIGFKIHLIEGGYKAFRAAMLEDIERMAPQQSRYQVISGPTGSGKTRLLQALKEEGAQVLDLEDLAQHRSSVLGHIPGQPQPSQKHFDTLVWQTLKQFDPAQVVFVESESRKVGNLSIPETLILAMRNSPCHELTLPLSERGGFTDGGLHLLCIGSQSYFVDG